MRIYGSSLIISGLLGFGVAGMSDEVYKVRQGWLLLPSSWSRQRRASRPGAPGREGGRRRRLAERKLQVGGNVLTLLSSCSSSS